MNKLYIPSYFLKCVVILFLIISLTDFSFATDSDDRSHKPFFHLKKSNDYCTELFNTDDFANLLTWINGEILSDTSLLFLTFDTDSTSFHDFINQYNINSLEITVNWENPGPTEELTNIVINDLAGFDPTTWASEIINPPMGNGNYSIEITYPDHNCGAIDELAVDFVPVIDEPEETPEIEITEYNCGDEYSPPAELSDTVKADQIAVGDIIFINALPVKISTLSSNLSPLSGTGLIALPFSKKTLKVEFAHVLINKYHQVFSIGSGGYFEAVANNSFDVGMFELDTLSIGGEICIPPPQPPEYDNNGYNTATGLDPYGFDSTGVNQVTGNEYDDNGFNQNGVHKETGDTYNSDGCNREGLDRDGRPCDPSGEESQESRDFYRNNESQITSQIDQAISDFLNLTDSKIDDQISTCDSIRAVINPLVDDVLAYDRTFIFGENEQYFNEGLSKIFETKPQPMILQTDRDSSTVKLEKEHIRLFECDVKLEELKEEITNYAILNNADKKTEFINFIKEKIERWDEEERNQYSDLSGSAFQEWLANNLLIFLSGDGNNTSLLNKGLGDNPYNIFQFETKDRGFHSALASIDRDFPLDFSAEEMFAENLFLFQQGHKYIQGVHRAYYVKEMYRQNEMLLGPEENNLMPIKISKAIGPAVYSIYLNKFTFTPISSSLNAYLVIEDPNSGKRIVFEGINLSFGPAGIIGESALRLASTLEMRLSNSVLLRLVSGENTYVAWDCDGFVGMSTELEFDFCRNYLVPLDGNLNPLPEPELLTTNIVLQMESWMEFYTEINLPPFAIAGYEDLKFEASQVVLDLSDNQSPTFIPLEGYSSPFYNGSVLLPKWRGFYLNNLSVQLPQAFSSDGQSAPKAVGVKDVLIDGTGVSGQIFAANLISIEDGSLGGWPFSIDTVQLTVLNNSFAGAGLAGEIKVPVFEGGTRYNAIMYPNNRYSFALAPLEDQNMDMLVANVRLSNNSMIEIDILDGEVNALATLHGSMDINAETDVANIEFPDISFQNFQVSNKYPYFSPGEWGISDDFSADINGFKLVVDKLTPFTNSSTESGLAINFGVEISRKVELSAMGTIQIVGNLSTDASGRQDWTHDRIEISGLSVDGSFPGVKKIEGELFTYKNDTKFGSGFKGGLHAQFEGIDISVTAVAQFGNVSTYEYFFVDAVADVNLGLGTGALKLKGFGGGVSFGVTSQGAAINLSGSGDQIPSELGAGLSGRIYEPDEDTGLGLRATAVIATAKEQLFNGTVTLGFEFDKKTNGLQKMEVFGVGKFISEIDLGIVAPSSGITQDTANSTPNVDAAFTAYVYLGFDFENSIFSGSLDVFLKSSIINGRGPGGYLVNADIYFSNEEWYIYLGTPDNRCGAKLSIAGLAEVNVSAYFNVGTNIPYFPELPSEVRSIARRISSNEALRQSGGGIMFGGALDIHITGGFGGIVSGELKAGLGFDIMLRHYKNAYCQGNDSDDKVGINGWYAAGQMWAYAEGNVKAFGIKILEAGIATVLQARLPNPTWAKATIGMKVKLLFFSKTFSFKIEVGEKCRLLSPGDEDITGIEVINYITPDDEARLIETTVQPEVYLAFPVNKNIKIPDANTGNEVNWRAEVQTISLVTREGINIPLTSNILDDNTRILIDPAYMLPGDDSLTLTVSISVLKSNTFIFNETRTISFTTSPALDYIPAENVAYSYPMNGMVHFLPDEYSRGKGFIQLNSGQPQLFNNIPDQHSYKVILTTDDGEKQYLDIDISGYGDYISFDLSSENLENRENYRLEFALIPNSELEGVSSTEESSSDPELNHRKTLFDLYFRTSIHNTFNDKIKSIENSLVSEAFEGKGANYDIVFVKLNSNEGFDNLEYDKFDPDKNLVSFEYLGRDQWFKYYKDIMYDDFPKTDLGELLTYVAPGKGSARLNIIDFILGDFFSIKNNRKRGLFLTQNLYEEKWIPEEELYNQGIRINIGQIVKEDFSVLQTNLKAFIKLISEDNDGFSLENVLTPVGSRYHFLSYQPYKESPSAFDILAKYSLPNGKTTSSYDIKFSKPNN